jgi:hypothetical protein
MSQAFIRETDDQWLNEIGPTMLALTNFLTRENGGIRVYEKNSYQHESGNTVHVMSNGLSYSKNEKGEWYVISV